MKKVKGRRKIFSDHGSNLDNKVIIERIGTMPDNEPYLWIGDVNDTCHATIGGRKLLLTAIDVMKAFGYDVVKRTNKPND